MPDSSGASPSGRDQEALTSHFHALGYVPTPRFVNCWLIITQLYGLIQIRISLRRIALYGGFIFWYPRWRYRTVFYWRIYKATPNETVYHPHTASMDHLPLAKHLRIMSMLIFNPRLSRWKATTFTARVAPLWLVVGYVRTQSFSYAEDEKTNLGIAWLPARLRIPLEFRPYISKCSLHLLSHSRTLLSRSQAPDSFQYPSRHTRPNQICHSYCSVKDIAWWLEGVWLAWAYVTDGRHRS